MRRMWSGARPGWACRAEDHLAAARNDGEMSDRVGPGAPLRHPAREVLVANHAVVDQDPLAHETAPNLVAVLGDRD